MELAKLNITPLDPSGEPSKDSIPVLFNPNSYSIVKPVTWTAAGTRSQRRERIASSTHRPSCLAAAAPAH